MQKKISHKNNDNQAKAVLKKVKTSTKKINEIAKIIRGKKVGKAIDILNFSRKKIALPVKKTLESAVANAENNHNLDIDELIVQEAYVGKNIIMKRWRPRAKGRVNHIKKPFSSITIVLAQQ